MRVLPPRPTSAASPLRLLMLEKGSFHPADGSRNGRPRATAARAPRSQRPSSPSPWLCVLVRCVSLVDELARAACTSLSLGGYGAIHAIRQDAPAFALTKTAHQPATHTYSKDSWGRGETGQASRFFACHSFITLRCLKLDYTTASFIALVRGMSGSCLRPPRLKRRRLASACRSSHSFWAWKSAHQ